MGTLHALDVVQSASIPIVPMVVLFGDDRFLQLEVVRHLIHIWLGDDLAEFAVTRLDGESAAWPDVADSVATGSLFSNDGLRVVVMDNGDEFVKKHRAALEERVQPRQPAGSVNPLVLFVESWPSNTRLFKLVEKSGSAIDCGPPTSTRGKSKQVDDGRVVDWLVARAKDHHQLKLSKTAARQMVELAPCNFGMYDQQLAKLACCVGEGKPISPEQVVEWLGGWKINTVWQMVDAAAEGDARTALVLLDELLRSGEHPLAMFGQISWSLRRYGEAVELFDRRTREGQAARIQDCLSPAGFRPWGGELQKAESRIARLGSRRARRIHRMLLQTDLALKGSHSHESRGRFALERLIAWVAAEKEPLLSR